jgi:hypothetical protein
MIDVYALAVDGFLPCLRSLRVHVSQWSMENVPGPLPDVTSLHMPQLETLDLHLNRKDKSIEWKSVEALTCRSVMPRLRQCTLVYSVSMSVEIPCIFASPLFDNDERHVHVRFMLHLDASVPIDLSTAFNISEVRSGRYNEIYVEYVSLFALDLKHILKSLLHNFYLNLVVE